MFKSAPQSGCYCVMGLIDSDVVERFRQVIVVMTNDLLVCLDCEAAA